MKDTITKLKNSIESCKGILKHAQKNNHIPDYMENKTLEIIKSERQKEK